MTDGSSTCQMCVRSDKFFGFDLRLDEHLWCWEVSGGDVEIVAFGRIVV